MANSESLCLWLVVDSLSLTPPADRAGAALPSEYRFAIWVLRSPYLGGLVHHDCAWDVELAHAWHSWQTMFSLRGLPQVPHILPELGSDIDGEAIAALETTNELEDEEDSQPESYSSRYMQHLGINLWRWLFSGPVESSFERSRGIATGRGTPLRVRLEIRCPEIIAVPWEIMQPQPGSQALSLNGKKILFSRTSSDVEELEIGELDQSLKILLVLGKPGEEDDPESHLHLAKEAELLKQILESNSSLEPRSAQRQVDVLLQPSAVELVRTLDKGDYNVFFYSGHGVPGADGGLLYLSEDTLSGTELAQMLVGAQVKLTVFNTCWGAQPEQTQAESLPRSSLAEVLLHHGLPAVVAMRDSIADDEAILFIQEFTQALAERKTVDESVASARQTLLAIYHFNQPAWTLPVLYMHPDFNGLLLESDKTTQFDPSGGWQQPEKAILRIVDDPTQTWTIGSDGLHIGRQQTNDLVLFEQWVSSSHAEIFYRRTMSQRLDGGTESVLEQVYYLRDNSRFGTFYLQDGIWKGVHRQEITLASGTQIRFGNRSDGPRLEFVVVARG